MKNPFRIAAFQRCALLFLVCTLVLPCDGKEGSNAGSLTKDTLPTEVELELHPGDPAQGDHDPRFVPTAIHAPPPNAAIPPIVTSRPSITDANTTIPQGSFQVESGATYTNSRHGGPRSWGLPESFLRLGLTDNTEIRFTTPNYIALRSDQSGSSINNFGDISVGVSHHIVLPGKIDATLIPVLNLPTGANNVSSNALVPEFRLSVGKPLTSKLGVGGHLDTLWNTGRAATATALLNPTLVVSYYPRPNFGYFVEYAGFYPTTGKSLQLLQTGLLYTPTPRQQFDIRIATGMNRTFPGIQVGFGYSFRLDWRARRFSPG